MPKSQDETYTIHIDGEWSLEDLYTFPRTFEQVYFFIYSLMPDTGANDQERIQHAYKAFPWQGGYSAVNFYNRLKYSTPKAARPQIVSIRYESPGWMELALILSVAVTAERIIKSIANSIGHAHDVYDRIVRGMTARKLLRLEAQQRQLQFRRQEVEYINYSVQQMANLFGFRNIAEINARTGHPYVTLKILLSLYRRVKILVDYIENGKAEFRNKR